MKPAAIGIRAHSGWGAVVVVSRNPANVEVIHRGRVAITDPKTPGAVQPYHFAQPKTLPDAERYLAACATTSERLAFEALRDIVKALRDHEYAVGSCAILLASGRALPPLEKILAAHPLIHTAEGEFFRQAFWKAAERLDLQVAGIPERELDARVEAVFSRQAIQVRREIETMGKSIGPPWTTDQKTASLAALLVLGEGA